MSRILESGLAEMQRGEQFRAFVDQASGHFGALGTPEAQQIAQLIRQNPQAATQYVNQFGGWEQMYNTARANAGRQALSDVMARLSPAAGAVTGLMSQQEVLQQVLPVAMKYGVGGDLLGQIAQAYGSAGPQAFDWEHAKPENFTPESFAAAWQAKDPTLLRAAANPGDQLIGGKYLRVLDANGNIVRAQRIPGMDYGEAGGGPEKPPSGYRWRSDGSLEPIPGGPATRESTPPPGYQWNDNGTLRAIPGGPGDMLHGITSPTPATPNATPTPPSPVAPSAAGVLSKYGAAQPEKSSDARPAGGGEGRRSQNEVVARAKIELAKGTDRKYVEEWMWSQGVSPGLLAAAPSWAKGSGRPTRPVAGRETPEDMIGQVGAGTLFNILTQRR